MARLSSLSGSQLSGRENFAAPLHTVRFPQFFGPLRRQARFQGVAGEARLGDERLVLAAIAEELAVKGVAAGAGNLDHARGFGDVQGFRGKEQGWHGVSSLLGTGGYLHCVSLPPTGRECQPVSIDKADKLSVMLDFVFKEIEGEVKLPGSQASEVDFVQALLG